MVRKKFPPIPQKVDGPFMEIPVKIGQPPEDVTGLYRSDDDGIPTMYIEGRQALPHQWQTWFHEWVHSLEHEGGFVMKDEPDDSDVDRLATVMLACFVRNGWKLPGE